MRQATANGLCALFCHATSHRQRVCAWLVNILLLLPAAHSQEGHCKPGEVLFGTDSHTCNAGAFGQFATGVGNTDAGFILGTGKLLLKVQSLHRSNMHCILLS
jgi:hypothetical protein